MARIIPSPEAYKMLDYDYEIQEFREWDALDIPSEMAWMDYITGEFVDINVLRRAYKQAEPMVYGAPVPPVEELSEVESVFIYKYLYSYFEDDVVEEYLDSDSRNGIMLMPDTRFRFAVWALHNYPPGSVDLSRGGRMNIRALPDLEEIEPSDVPDLDAPVPEDSVGLVYGPPVYKGEWLPLEPLFP
jgi:hypothetical protein